MKTPSRLVCFGGPSLGAILIATACSNAPPAESAPVASAAPEPTEPSEPKAEEAPVELSPEAAALIAETEGDGAPAASPTPAPAPTDAGEKGHNLVYRVKPDALHIEVMNADFVPTARAVRVRDGWGVEVKVEGTTTEDVSLLGSNLGPLAFAARVRRPSEEKFADQREGTKDVLLTPENPLIFRRTWPGTDAKPLTAGQTLEIQVGLWGLGETAATRKPVRRFFTVKLKVDRQGGTATVEPPQ